MNGISISTTIFCPKGQARRPLAAGLEALAETGYKLIEISRRHLGPAMTADEFAKRDLKVWAIHGGLEIGAVSGNETTRRQAVASEIARMAGAAVFAPCPYVVHYLDRFRDPAAGIAFRRSVEELLAQAEALGFNLAVETVPDKAANEKYPDTGVVAGFVRSFKSSAISVCVDLNHSNLREDLAQVAQNCAGLISNIHVSDNRGVVEEHLPPGAGGIDLPAALRALAGAGYRGPLNLECRLPTYPTPAELSQMRMWAERTLAALPGTGTGSLAYEKRLRSALYR